MEASQIRKNYTPSHLLLNLGTLKWWIPNSFGIEAGNSYFVGFKIFFLALGSNIPMSRDNLHFQFIGMSYDYLGSNANLTLAPILVHTAISRPKP